MKLTRKICSRCILDDTIEGIAFDENGICNFCSIHDTLEMQYPLDDIGKDRLKKIVAQIQKDGRGKRYDCVVGVSGGRDSTYTLYMAVSLGLRPLAVHFDNGWNSETAVTNIHHATEKLDVDLYTVVADWEEFKELQRSFLYASVPDADVPTDWAIYSVLFKVAAKEGLHYVIQGHSFRTEGTSPITWTYMDGRYIRSVQRQFGKKKITSFPIMGFWDLVTNICIRRIKEIRLLEYVEYNKDTVDQLLSLKLGWTYYGGHHHESMYTRFFQSYYLPHKFGIDKRKLEYAAQVRSGQMGRKEALEKIKEPYLFDPEIVSYTITKLNLTEEEFDTIMKLPKKSFLDYPTYYPYINLFRVPVKIACRFHLLPPILAEKYVKKDTSKKCVPGKNTS